MLGLLTPWFLAGLGALAVPVLVHLMHREQKDVVRFPSLMFLQRIPYQTQRRQKLRHWLLFLLRCLAVVLLVMAFARPFRARQAIAPSAGAQSGRDVLILLDRSYSMEYRDRWQRAVTAAKGAVEKLGRSDRAAVVYFAGTASLATELTGDKRALLAAIDSVRPTASATRYDAAFRLVQQVFGDTARPRREVVLVSDYQRSAWGGRELPSLPTGTTLTQVNLGDSVTTNVLISHVGLRYDTAAGRERVIVAAHLVNRDTKPVVKRSVTLEVNGRQEQTASVDLAAGGAVDVNFDGVPLPQGVSRGTVRAGTDSLTRDNIFHFVATRRPSLSVLLVGSSTADRRASLFLTRAFAVGKYPSFDLREIKVDDLSADRLKAASLVILNDVPVPGGEVGERLAEYVKKGGGLLVALGNGSQPTKWPALADELLPRPGATVVDRLADNGATLGFIDRGHAVFEAFNAPRSGDFSAARFFRYWPTKPAAGDRQLARLDDGNVILLERHVGAGYVLVWNSDLAGLWNDLPLQPIFLPFMHQTAKYVAGYKEDESSMAVGEALNPLTVFDERTRVADSAAARKVAAAKAQYVVIAPSGTQVRFGIPGAPASLELTEQGFYEIKRTGGVGGDAARTIAANVNLAESDLTPLDTELFTAALAAPTGKDATKAAAPTPADLERRQSVWWYLLIAMLLMLGVETLLSNRLSRSTAR